MIYMSDTKWMLKKVSFLDVWRSFCLKIGLRVASPSFLGLEKVSLWGIQTLSPTPLPGKDGSSEGS